jgi:hypothetical protein
MLFFLGTHKPDWLERADVPLFVSHRELSKRKTSYNAKVPWALDSGGFTELSQRGRWGMTAKQYGASVADIMRRIPNLQFAAPMDWMCEPVVLQRTGLTVEEHQRRTIDNFLELQSLQPDVPWIPVLQGWTMGDYMHHVEDYLRRGVDLRFESLVGVGTICRRQSSIRATHIMAWLQDEGIRLHGFGFKTGGLVNACQYLVSADSLAWSFDARRVKKEYACPWGHKHKKCVSCIDYALDWRAKLMRKLDDAGCIDEWESGVREVRF